MLSQVWGFCAIHPRIAGASLLMSNAAPYACDERMVNFDCPLRHSNSPADRLDLAYPPPELFVVYAFPRYVIDEIEQ
jgi:hypothetical protein